MRMVTIPSNRNEGIIFPEESYAFRSTLPVQCPNVQVDINQGDRVNVSACVYREYVSVLVELYLYTGYIPIPFIMSIYTFVYTCVYMYVWV